MVSAKLVIDKQIPVIEEDKESSLILATYFSKAYNLIDHEILMEKLEHHGVVKRSIELIKSFSFVEI